MTRINSSSTTQASTSVHTPLSKRVPSTTVNKGVNGMSSSRFVVVEVDNATGSSALANLLLSNGYDRISILNSIWKHPELRYGAPPDDLLNKWMANRNRVHYNNDTPSRNGHDYGHHNDNMNTLSSRQRLEMLVKERPVKVKSDPHSFDGQHDSSDVPPVGAYQDDIEDDVDDAMNTSVDGVLLDPRLFPSASKNRPAPPSSDRKSSRSRIPSKKRRSCPPDEEGHVVCHLCHKHVPTKSASLRKHVQRNHCELKSYVCPHCPYSHERPMVRAHIMSRHAGSGAEPVDMRDRKMYEVWNTLMKKCFPVQFGNVEWAIPHWQTAAAADSTEVDNAPSKSKISKDHDQIVAKVSKGDEATTIASALASPASIRLNDSDDPKALSSDLRAIPASSYRIHEDMDWHSYQPKKMKQIPPEQQHGYTCEKCKRQVHCQQNRVMFLRYHCINIHSDYKPYNCSECDRGAATKCQVRIHINKCHARIGDVLENRTPDLEAHWDSLVVDCFPSRFELLNMSDDGEGSNQ